ncbi:MAG: hypothetical protein ACP5OR_05300 [Candidatus Dormibacteria bacterium]
MRAVLAVDSEHAYCVLASAVGHPYDVEEIGRLLRREAEHAQTRTCFTDERVLTLLAEASAAMDLCIVRENQVQVQGSDIPSVPIENAARNALADKGQRVGRTMDARAMERGGMVTMSREELA